MFLKFIRFLFYYLLIFLGVFMLFWFLWMRFIRERTVRYVPDYLFTEHRFWILIYICIIYLIIIKNLIKPMQPKGLLKTIFLEKLAIFNYYFLMPLKILDHSIKYNKYIKPYYYKFIAFLSPKLNYTYVRLLIITFQIIPQSILILALFMDIFYYGKIFYFYEILIVGLFLLVFRYYKYSLHDIMEEYVKELENKYDVIVIHYDEDEDDQWDDDNETHDEYIARRNKRNMIWDCERVKPREYIEIKYENHVLRLTKNFAYKYMGTPYYSANTAISYKKNKYNNENAELTYADKKELEEVFFMIEPQILCIRLYLYFFTLIENDILIKNLKVFIFFFYFIAWFLVLVISYYHFPVELKIFKSFIEHIGINLIKENNPFSG